MKYIVGYPIKGNQTFLNSLIQNKESVSEIYFSWGDLPNGRSVRSAFEERGAFEIQMRQSEDLKRLSDEGFRFNLLFNANCYGKESQSRAFFNKIGNLTDYIQRNFGLASVTTTSPLIAKFMKENFDGIDVRASVNMEIGSVEGIAYVARYFDSFYVQRELNRNFRALLRLRRFCDENGKQMYLLANSGCLNHCSAHIFHDNLVAHENEISEMDNGYQFRGVCWDFLKNSGNRDTWLQKTNFIRPEDIELYESLVPAVKLATRVNASPSRILNAYVNQRYRGSVMELLEPNHSGLFYPEYIENSNFRRDFAEHVMHCNQQCESCDFCASAMREACVRLAEDSSQKV
ncbi:MAG: hypothetical protein E7649_02280 [Ruminococcaceae bacterium]|nr:hypothetical protein [Oscillospiraceae bacterium]